MHRRDNGCHRYHAFCSLCKRDIKNCLVKLKRGKLFYTLPEETEIIKDVLNKAGTNLDFLDAAEIDDNN